MKVRHSILAVLALLCSASLFTACGSDDDDSKPAADNTRVYVGLFHSAQITDDMLKYFNVEVITTNGAGKVQSYTVTKEKLENGKFEATVVGQLPCELKVETQVTVKPDADFTNVESIKYFRGSNYSYVIRYYNAESKAIANQVTFGGMTSSNPTTAPNSRYSTIEAFVQAVRDGYLDHTSVKTFDKAGNLVNSTVTTEDPL